MRKDRFQALLKTTYDRMVELTATKGEEYANNAPIDAPASSTDIRNQLADAQDQHANFKRLASELGMTPEQVLSVYLTKHLDATKSYLKHGRVWSEPIEGRIDDAILYLILLKGLIIERREVNFNPG